MHCGISSSLTCLTINVTVMSSFTEQCDVISWQIYRPHHADFDGEKLPRIFQLTHEMGMYGFSARPVSCWAFLKLKFESQ